MISTESVPMPVVTIVWDGTRRDATVIVDFLRSALAPDSLARAHLSAAVGTNPKGPELLIQLEEPDNPSFRSIYLRKGEEVNILIDPSRSVPIYVTKNDLREPVMVISESRRAIGI